MRGWACLVLICHHQKQTFGGRRKSSRDFTYFRVPCDMLRSSWKWSSPCFQHVPTGSRAKAFILQARHRRFVGDSAFHASLRGAPVFVGDTAEVVSSPATSTEFDATNK